MEVIKTTQPYKLKVNCLPLLEDTNYQHHYEYDNPKLDILFTLPEEYPVKSHIQFYIETNHPRIAFGTTLSDLKDQINEHIAIFNGEPCMMEIIEFTRVSISTCFWSRREGSKYS
jgi:hypothetical protein